MENSPLLPDVFITGTGADVGKTIVTDALLRATTALGRDPCAIKPLQTGLQASSANADASIYQLFAPNALTATLQSFTLAAGQAGKDLAALDIVRSIRAYFAASAKNFLLREGADGIHVPINENMDMLDLMKLLALPCRLVCAMAMARSIAQFYPLMPL